jgi:hypothetical protein
VRHFKNWFARRYIVSFESKRLGIRWIRIYSRICYDRGLWWKDLRVAPPDRFVDYHGRKFRVGHYLIAILPPQ